MDSFTHILTGMAVGQLFSKEIERFKFRPVIWGAIIANIPDVDGVFQLLLPAEDAVTFHRGISHSLFLWVLCSPLLALLINKIYKGNRYTYLRWFKISVIAWFSHIFLDIFNTYGTGIFEPFSHIRVTFDLINVIDLIMTIPVLALVITFIFIVKNYQKKLRIALAAIMYPLAYMTIVFTFKMYVENSATLQLANKHIFPSRMISSPLPLSPFAWKVVAETYESYHITTVYGFWKKQSEFTCIEKNGLLEVKYLFLKKYQKVKQFTKRWCHLERKDGQVYMYDLRFSTLDPEKHALSFILINEDKDLEIKQTQLNRHITFKNIINVYKRLFESEQEEQYENVQKVT
jgi:inner membrane protein